MKEIRIPFHSYIDVITNSSTEIFASVSNNAKDIMTEILTSVLKAAGSNKTVDEIFDIEFIYNEEETAWCPCCEYDITKTEEDELGNCGRCHGNYEIPIKDLTEEEFNYINESVNDGLGFQKDISIKIKSDGLEGKNIISRLNDVFVNTEISC